MAEPSAVLVMGVSGSGKSSVGALLASKLGWKFYDADDYHPEENRVKMSTGIPLNDQDRIPWLCRLHDILLSCDNIEIKCEIICKSTGVEFQIAQLSHNSGPSVNLDPQNPDWDMEDMEKAANGDTTSGQHVVLACSALKKIYRDILIQGKDGAPCECEESGKEGKPAEVKLLVVHLNGSFEVISERLRKRKGHFMPPELLQSQFDALEPPSAPENFIQVSVDKSLSDIIATIMETLK